MLGNWLSESPAPKIPTFVAVKKEWDMSKGEVVTEQSVGRPWKHSGILT